MSAATVLIADDDRDLVCALEARCRGLGLQVITAHDGLTALKMAQAQKPRLLCLDVNMPSGSGLSVCEMLAGDEGLRDTLVVILTGDSAQETIRRCHGLCAYFVPKCSDVWSRLGPLIEELLGMARVDSR